MLKIILFSFQRALQLDALLRTLFARMKIKDFQVDVIYNGYSSRHLDAYEILADKWRNYPLHFIREKAPQKEYRFRELLQPDNFKHWMKHRYIRNPRTDFRNAVLAAANDADFVMFLTDDSIFIRDVAIPDEIFSWIARDQTMHSFSLRHGIRMNHPPMKQIFRQNDSVIYWDFRACDPATNWGYPFSVDGHIYGGSFLRALCRDVLFSNPSSLEANCCTRMRRKRQLAFAKASTEPYLLSFPLNMVQQTVKNESCGISCEMLNDRFWDGWQLEYEIPREIVLFQQYPERIFFVRGEEKEEFIVR